MRLPLLLAALTLSLPAAAQAPALPDGATSPGTDCRSARPHVANSRSEWHGEQLRPETLDELPPATAYMAVHRTIDGCAVPMTAAEYRNSFAR